MSDPLLDVKRVAIAQRFTQPTNTVNRVLKAKQDSQQRLLESSAQAINSLKQQSEINKAQINNEIGSLYTDSDIARSLVGGTAKGVGGTAEGFGYSYGKFNNLIETAKNFINPNKNSDPSALYLARKFISYAIQKDASKVYNYGEKTHNERDIVTQHNIAQSTPTGDIFDPSSYSLGENPTLSGYGHQLLGILSEFAPQAAGLLAKGVPGLAISAATGGAQAGASQGREAKKYIENLDQTTLEESSQLYNDLRLNHPLMTHEEAKAQVAESAKTAAFATGAVIGGVGGAATNYILKPLQKKLSGSATGRVIKTVGLSGIEEATQEVTESVASRAAAKHVAGGTQNLTEGTFGDAVLGGSFGSALGGAGGAIGAVTDRAVKQRTEAIEQVNQARTQSQAVSEAIAEKRYKDLIDPEKQNQYPLKASAIALADEIKHQDTTPEQKKEASSALVTLENQAIKKLDEVKNAPNELDINIEKVEKGIDQVKVLLESPEDLDTEDLATLEQSLVNLEDDLKNNKKIKSNFDSKQHKQVISELESDIATISEFRRVLIDNDSEINESSDALIETLNSNNTPSPEIKTDSVKQLTEKVVLEPTTVTNQQLEKLASNPQLDKQEQGHFQKLFEARQLEDALKDSDQLKQTIFEDNKTTGYKSIQQYRSDVAAALRGEDGEAAKRALQGIKTFTEGHVSKAKAARKAFENIKLNNIKEQQIIPTQSKGKFTWITPQRPFKKSFLRKHGGLVLNTQSEKVINQIEKEAELLNLVLNQVSKIAETIETSEKKQDSKSALKKLQKEIESDSNTSIKTITDFANKYGSPEHKGLLRKLTSLPHVKTLGSVTTDTKESTVDNKKYKAVGTYDPNKHAIAIDVSALNSLDESGLEHFIESIIHELSHAVTYDSIEKNAELKNDLTEINKEIKEWLNQDNNKEKIKNIELLEYAIQNEQELIATVLGSAQLKRDLSIIPSSKNKNMLSEFSRKLINYIKKLVKLEQPEISILERVLNSFDNAIKLNEGNLNEQLASEQNKTPKTNSEKNTTLEYRQQTQDIKQLSDKETEKTEIDKEPGTKIFAFEREAEPIKGPISQEQLFSINRLSAFFTNSNKTAIGQINNFISTTVRDSINDIDQLIGYGRVTEDRLEKFKERGDPKSFINDFLNHRDKWHKDIDRLFRPNKTHSWQKPLNFFTNEEGNIDGPIKDAISVASYNFVTENHNNLWFNYTDNEKKAVLNLERTEEIPIEQSQAIFDKGRRDNSVIMELGNAAYQAAGLSLNTDAPINESELIKGALGNMALAVLLDSQYFQRNELPGSLFNSTGNKHEKHFFIRSNKLKENNEWVNNPKLEIIKTNAKGHQGFLNDLFGVEHIKTIPQSKPFKVRQKKAKNSDMEISKKQKQLLQKANNKPYFIKTDLVGEKGLINRFSDSLLGKVIGKIDIENEPVHIVNREGIQGKNDALDREIEAVKEHIKDQKDFDLKKPFYINHVVWKQYRVGQDSAGINPQNSKFHRALITIDDWNTTINLSTGENLKEFQLGVMEALEGALSGVKTDSAPSEKVLKSFSKLLENEDILLATDVLQQLADQPDRQLSQADENAIAAGVKAGGENTHSLIGLIALTKYRDAKENGKNTFTSDLMREGDGKNNGPIIALLQMGLSGDLKKDSQLMAMGGLYTKQSQFKNYAEYADKAGLDLYKYIAKRANKVMQQDKINNPNKQKDYQLLTTLMGDIVNDKGEVTKDGRNATKNPVTTIMFGAGIDGVLNGMAETFIEKFYSQLEKNHNNASEIELIFSQLNQLFPNALKVKRSQVIDPLLFKLDPGQKKILKNSFLNTFGVAIEESINNEFGNLLTVRRNMNKAVNMMAEMYKLAFDFKVNEKQKENANIIKERGETPFDLVKLKAKSKNGIYKGKLYQPALSQPELNEIKKELKDLFPAIHTYFSLKENNIASGLAAIKEQKESSQNNAYKAESDFNEFRFSTEHGLSKPIKSMNFAGLETQLTAPGVGLPIMGIHSTDSYINMQAYANNNVLNNHDAITGSMIETPKIMTDMNKVFMESQANYSIPKEIENALNATLTAFSELKSTNPNAFEYDTDFKKFAKDFKIIAQLAEDKKLAFLKELKYVDQYYMEDGAFEVSDKIKSKKIDIKLASPPQNSNPAIGYSTEEMFDAMNRNDPMDPNKANNLKDILNNIVTKLHGPVGSDAAFVKATLGETPVELAARMVAEGNYNFSSAIQSIGLSLKPAEEFVLEQIELITRGSLDGSSSTDKEIVSLFKKARSQIDSNGRIFHEGDWSQATQAEKEQAKAIYDFIFKVDSAGARNLSNHISRFVALTHVYDPLRNALNFEINTDVKITGKLGERLEQVFNQIVQSWSNFSNNIHSGQKAEERLKKLIENLVINEHKRRLEQNREANTIEEELNDGIERLGKKVRDTVSDIGRSDFFQKDRSIKGKDINLIKTAGSAIAVTAEDRVAEVYAQLEQWRNSEYQKKPLGLLTSIANEVRGERPETRELYELNRKTNKIEQERKNLLVQLSDLTLNKFSDPDNISDFEKSAISQVFLRNDLGALLKDYSVAEIFQFVRDPLKRQNEIQKRLASLTKFKFNRDYVTDAKDLAYFMATGKNVSEHLYKNVHNIAHQYSTKNTVEETEIEQVKEILDPLVSLLALDYTSQTELHNLERILIQEETRGNDNALHYVLNMHNKLQEDALTELFNDNPIQMIKGYVKESYNPYNTVVAATEEEGIELEKEGYIKLHEVPRDLNDPDSNQIKALYKLKGIGLQSFETGMISYKGLQRKGSTLNSANSITTDEQAYQYKQGRLKSTYTNKIQKRYKRSNSNNYDPRKQKGGLLAPIFNDKGDVANYHYLMTHHNRDAVMGRDNAFESILAHTKANQFDKTASEKHNKMIIESLHRFFNKDYIQNSDAYVEVSDEATDPQIREVYRLLPERTKQAIRDIWGADRLFIRNDLLDVAFGYRHMSLTDPFGRNPETRSIMQNTLIDMLESAFGKKATTHLRKAEDLWKEAVRLLKDIVVIRNLHTLLGNIASNMTLLIWYGVPLKSMGRMHKEAIAGLLKYQEDQAELIRLKNDLSASPKTKDLKDLSEKIKELQFELERNPVHNLVEAGMFQTILEDIDSQKKNKQFKSPTEEKVEKLSNKLPDVVVETSKQLFVSPDTPLYKILAKATQSSDFVGRYVLYDYLVNRKRKPLDPKEALSQVSEAFVNYDIPNHKSLQYANAMGLMLFTKYYLRIQKIIYNLSRSHPLKGLMIAIADRHISEVQSIIGSSALTRGLNNPVDPGAFGLFGALDEPIPLKMLFNLTD